MYRGGAFRLLSRNVGVHSESDTIHAIKQNRRPALKKLESFKNDEYGSNQKSYTIH